MEDEPRIPHQSYARLFLRFLRFGFLAWGGPVAQIAMIKRELVEEERWISTERFNRALAVYQVLPGPEAHELCVYFGMLARGRVGAILAGLGFMLPGFVLMMALSWVYVTYGIRSPVFAAVFAPVQAAVIALIARAVFRIGRGVVTDGWLWGIAILAGAGHLFGVHFAIMLLFGGVGYLLVQRKAWVAGVAWSLVCAGSAAWWVVSLKAYMAGPSPAVPTGAAPATELAILGSGLKAGLLTFGGAYTAIPFLRDDAVSAGWMTNEQFLDGLGLSGILPAPLIIFATFAGFFVGGGWGGVLMTVGIFLPAFSFTLLGHGLFERIVRNERLKSFLDGVTAAVVGLIAATAVLLVRSGIRTWFELTICAVALGVLVRWHSKLAVPVVIGCAAIAGATLYSA